MLLKKILLNFYYWPIFLLITIIGIIITPALIVGNIIFSRMPIDQFSRLLVRLYGWILIRIVPFMAPVVLEDRSGGLTTPTIFVPNHCSSVDPYLFGMLPVDNAFVTSWPFKIPIYNFFMRLAGYINSTNGWKHVQEKGTDLIKSGCSLIIWPEGHRSRNGKLGRFKNGAFQLALATGRPIVPVCIVGSRQLLSPGKRFLTPARIKLILLPAILPVNSNENGDDIKNLKKKTRDAIAEELTRQQSASTSK